VGIDFVDQRERMPEQCEFWEADILNVSVKGNYFNIVGCTRMPKEISYADAASIWVEISRFDFIVASPPCEEFSVHGMKCFHKNPKYPEMGIKLFNHTRQLCEESGLPYILENVRVAQKFVGDATHHTGPFYLWGNSVPPFLPRVRNKVGRFHGMPGSLMEREMRAGKTRSQTRNDYQREVRRLAGSDKGCASFAAEIPEELSDKIADYAERLLERKVFSF